MFSYPSNLDPIFDKLIKQNIKPIIVGGFVRDSILGISSKDIDIELYGLASFLDLENLLKEFGDVNVVGKSFGVCKLRFEGYDLDFSLPRVENKIDSGHRGFEVFVDPNLDFQTAASRRDFTINSMGYDLLQKRVLDPFGGVSDLKNRILRASNLKKFGEDPLRVLRAAQFCARFELSMDKDLFLLCRDMVLKNMLSELPKERVFEEIKKILLKSKKPSYGFKLLKEFGVDLYMQNIDITDEIAKQLKSDPKTDITLMLAGLFYNLKEGEIKKIISDLTSQKELVDTTLELVKFQNEINTIYANGVDDYQLYKLSTKADIYKLLILSSSIYFTKNSSRVYEAGEEIYKYAKSLNILYKKAPAILMGKDLIKFGLIPSKEFSKILNEAYEAQIKGKFKDHSGAILWLKSYL
jgi:tRNA nucleotidyltransferase (CCA-adding enzyme)